MKAKTHFYLLLLVLPVAILSFTKKTAMYTYIDGNNNSYTITADSIHYKPVTPSESSSGIYSGGKPKSVKITAEQFLRIELLIKKMEKDKGAQIKNREMGCGTIVIKKKSYYFSAKDKNNIQLFEELKALVSGI